LTLNTPQIYADLTHISPSNWQNVIYQTTQALAGYADSHAKLVELV
jgi:hypothetical protein